MYNTERILQTFAADNSVLPKPSIIMPLDQIILLAIIVASSTLYATRWLPFEATSILVIAGIALTGLQPPEEALAGFASSATLTVGAMFVLSTGLVRTGALEAVTINLARLSNGSPRRLLMLLAVTVPVGSAFVNDTPVVVMLIPVVLSLSAQFGVRPSKLLMPVAYFAMLGGTLTLFGTSTNILMDDLYRQAGGPGFGVFTFAPLGVIYAAVGGTFVVLFSNRLLPDRSSLSELTSGRQASTYITEIEIGPASTVIGQPVEEAFERIARLSQRQEPPEPTRRHRRLQRRQPDGLQPGPANNSIEMLAVFRDSRVYHAEETRNLLLQPNDSLMVAGTAKEIAQFLESTRSALASVLVDGQRTTSDSLEAKVMEAVVLPDSRLNGRVIGDMELNRLYGAKIMGVQRQGRQLMRGLRNMRLSSGDVLLLQGEPASLHAAGESEQLLLVEGVDQSILRQRKNRLALLIMLGVILSATLTSIPIAILALTGAGLMVVTRCLRADEALRSLEPRALLLLAAAIPMGHAMETTGLAQSAVNLLLSVLGDANPVIFLSLFYLLANLLAQFISAKAVAVLFTPIALSLAAALGLNPTALLITIAFGTAASFLTPMGHQVNAIVMGPGSYSFGDYVRFGLPMTILMWLTGSIFIPLFWPL